MKPFLDVNGLTKYFGSLLLFQNLSFSIGEGEFVGLIARNGVGKSTLLNILSGAEDYDEGQIVARKDLRIAYLSQTPHLDLSLPVINACLQGLGETADVVARYEVCMEQNDTDRLDGILAEMDAREAWNLEYKAKEVLTKLHITDFEQPLGELSGGQAKRVALANVLLQEPDLIILDEPTNHLDIDMIVWLENYLKRNIKAMLLVTHDRYFLDSVCQRIIEIDDAQLYRYDGNYEYYLEKRAERMAAAASEVARANNLYRRELEWMRRMPQARGGKAKYRKDAFYDLQEKARRRPEEKAARLQVKTEYIGSKIFEAQYVSKSFPLPEGGTKVILKDFYYNFSRYEKMGIVGNNGTGKSTFIKLLLGEIQPDSGRFVVGETVRFGYYSQDGMKFDNQMKVIDAVRAIAETVDLGGGRKMTAMQFLSHFLFPPARQQDYIYILSGGERRRLYLCTVLMQAPNFLILDEPTNDLDIATLQVLEEFLTDFKGCVIAVSHDRYFLDRMADHLLVFNGQGDVDDFPGNYTQYREWKQQKQQEQQREQEQMKKKKPAVDAPRREAKEKPVRLTFKQRLELEELTTGIELLEKEKAALEQQLCLGTLSSDELTEKSKRLYDIQEELKQKEERWLELSMIGEE